jgi:osmotically-inducible protein OsmY
MVQLQPAVGTAVPLPVTTLAGSSYTTWESSKRHGLQPVSHAATVTSIAGMPTGYVLQAVDGQPVTTPVLDSHTILEEMKVELALLADPATFACNLSAKLDGNAMLVRGFVPNEAVRERALQAARTGTHLTVADGLKVHRSLAMRAAGVPVAALQQGAQDLLAEGFPEIAAGIEAKATITGQITLTGTARSFEEKLAVSQRLRRLNGCTAVVNQLKVPPIVKDGQSLTMVTADGMHVVPPEVAMDTPMEGIVPAMRAGREISPVPLAVTMTPISRPVAPAKPSAMEAPPMARTRPAAPASPSAMEVPPTARTLPSALPAPTGSVSRGTVTFDDAPEAKATRHE